MGLGPGVFNISQRTGRTAYSYPGWCWLVLCFEKQQLTRGHQIHWMNPPSTAGFLGCDHFWWEGEEVLFQIGASSSGGGGRELGVPSLAGVTS